MNKRRMYGHEALVEFNQSKKGKVYFRCWEIFNKLVKKDPDFYSKFLLFLESQK